MTEAKRIFLNELVATYDGDVQTEFTLEPEVLEHIENMEENLKKIDEMSMKPDMEGMAELMKKAKD